jgi:hypothetical protein
LKEGALAELLVDDDSFVDPGDVERFNIKGRVMILPAGAQLFACMRLRDEFPSTPDLVQGIRTDPPLDARCGLIPFKLEADLFLLLRGTKAAELDRCACHLVTLGIAAPSINRAYTLLSERYEKWREAHTGNVFSEVFFLEEGIGNPLDVLRQRATADFEKELFRRSGLLPLETRTRPKQ